MKITDYVTIIRERREKECFPVINRGLLWYDRLSKSQLSELERWYQAWLDAPETGEIPAFPTWINAKTEKNVEEILI